MLCVNLHAGVAVSLPDGRELICKCIMLQTSLDMPARSAVTNMKLFNGEHSCSTCQDPGDNIRSGHPLHRVWPFSSSFAIWTKESVYRAIRLSVESGEAVRNMHVCKHVQCTFKLFTCQSCTACIHH